ncbi:ABC transporter six-transmembrane domain-containing protein, partial [Pasteurella multocida]
NKSKPIITWAENAITLTQSHNNFINFVISIAGAVLMLLVIEFWSGLTALVILLFFALLAPRYTRTNDRLYFKLNNHLENDVKMIERSHTPHLTRHYDFYFVFADQYFQPRSA